MILLGNGRFQKEKYLCSKALDRGVNEMKPSNCNCNFFFSDENVNYEVPLVAANLPAAEPARFNGIGQNWPANRKDDDSMEVRHSNP